MDQARELVNADRCTLFLVDRASNKLVSQIADGTAQITIGLDEGIAGTKLLLIPENLILNLI